MCVRSYHFRVTTFEGRRKESYRVRSKLKRDELIIDSQSPLLDFCANDDKNDPTDYFSTCARGNNDHPPAYSPGIGEDVF